MRRRRNAIDPALRSVFDAFWRTNRQLEEATETLLLGVPSGRAPRLPLAEALAGFEHGLAEARDRMEGWRAEGLEREWRACLAALGQSADRAEGLRLGGGPSGYEELAPLLDALIEPLDAFGHAARRVRELGG